MKTISEFGNPKIKKAIESFKFGNYKDSGADTRIFPIMAHSRVEREEDSDIDLMVVVPDDLYTREIRTGFSTHRFEIGLNRTS